MNIHPGFQKILQEQILARKAAEQEAKAEYEATRMQMRKEYEARYQALALQVNTAVKIVQGYSTWMDALSAALVKGSKIYTEIVAKDVIHDFLGPEDHQLLTNTVNVMLLCQLFGRKEEETARQTGVEIASMSIIDPNGNRPGGQFEDYEVPLLSDSEKQQEDAKDAMPTPAPTPAPDVAADECQPEQPSVSVESARSPIMPTLTPQPAKQGPSNNREPTVFQEPTQPRKADKPRKQSRGSEIIKRYTFMTSETQSQEREPPAKMPEPSQGSSSDIKRGSRPSAGVNAVPKIAEAPALPQLAPPPPIQPLRLIKKKQTTVYGLVQPKKSEFEDLSSDNDSSSDVPVLEKEETTLVERERGGKDKRSEKEHGTKRAMGVDRPARKKAGAGGENEDKELIPSSISFDDERPVGEVLREMERLAKMAMKENPTNTAENKSSTSKSRSADVYDMQEMETGEGNGQDTELLEETTSNDDGDDTASTSLDSSSSQMDEAEMEMKEEEEECEEADAETTPDPEMEKMEETAAFLASLKILKADMACKKRVEKVRRGLGISRTHDRFISYAITKHLHKRMDEARSKSVSMGCGRRAKLRTRKGLDKGELDMDSVLADEDDVSYATILKQCSDEVREEKQDSRLKQEVLETSAQQGVVEEGEEEDSSTLLVVDEEQRDGRDDEYEHVEPVVVVEDDESDLHGAIQDLEYLFHVKREQKEENGEVWREGEELDQAAHDNDKFHSQYEDEDYDDVPMVEIVDGDAEDDEQYSDQNRDAVEECQIILDDDDEVLVWPAPKAKVKQEEGEKETVERQPTLSPARPADEPVKEQTAATQMSVSLPSTENTHTSPVNAQVSLSAAPVENAATASDSHPRICFKIGPPRPSTKRLGEEEQVDVAGELDDDVFVEEQEECEEEAMEVSEEQSSLPPPPPPSEPHTSRYACSESMLPECPPPPPPPPSTLPHMYSAHLTPPIVPGHPINMSNLARQPLLNMPQMWPGRSQQEAMMMRGGDGGVGGGGQGNALGRAMPPSAQMSAGLVRGGMPNPAPVPNSIPNGQVPYGNVTLPRDFVYGPVLPYVVPGAGVSNTGQLVWMRNPIGIGPTHAQYYNRRTRGAVPGAPVHYYHQNMPGPHQPPLQPPHASTQAAPMPGSSSSTEHKLKRHNHK